MNKEVRLCLKMSIILVVMTTLYSCTKEQIEVPPPPKLAWRQMSSPTNEDLNDLWGANDNSIFAVGNNGTIVQFNGSEWEAMTNTVQNNFRGVWGSSYNSVFAVGSSNTNAAYYNGTEWAVQELDFLRSIWGSASDVVYAVGKRGGVKFYDGATWHSFAAPALRDLYGVWGSAENNVYMVGDLGLVFNYNGTTWSPMSSSVAQCMMPADAATVVQWEFSPWQLEHTCRTGPGQPLHTFLFEYDVREPSLVEAAAIKSAEIDIEYYRAPEYGLGKNMSLYYYLNTADGVITVGEVSSGTFYSTISCNSSLSGIVHVDVSDALRGAINGSRDYIGFRMEAGDYYGFELESCPPWMTVTLESSPPCLKSIWGNAKNDVYAVGTSGTILHYDGQSWTRMDSGTFYDLNDVWGSSAQDVFAVGSAGRIVHYDGVSWTTMASATSNNLYGIWGSSSTNVYAVGEKGLILRYGE